MPRRSPVLEDLEETRDGLVVVAGQILLGTTSITSQDIPGAVVTRTGAGAYTVTFRNDYARLMGYSGTIVRATATDTLPRLNSNLTNRRVVTLITGTLAAPATGVDSLAGSKLLLEFVLQGKQKSR